MDSGKKKKIQILFIGLILFLPLQYGIVGVVGEIHSEPWPAFVFPGFKNVYSTSQSVDIKQHLFKVYSDDRQNVKEIRPQQLFPALPLSQIPGFMRTHFQDPTSIEYLSEEAVIWLYRLLKEYCDENPDHVEIIIRENRYVYHDGSMKLDSLLHEEIIPIQKLIDE